MEATPMKNISLKRINSTAEPIPTEPPILPVVTIDAPCPSRAAIRETRDEVPHASSESEGGVALLRLASALFASSDLAELEQQLLTGFGRLFDAPMYGLYILDPLTGRPGDVAPVNVSETFLARYERLPQGRETDPMLAHVLASGEAAYNMGLMSMEEWLESPLYTHVSFLHDLRHVVEVPVVRGESMIGTINFATSEPDRGYSAGEVRLAEALGRLVGVAVEGIRAREDVEFELERARAALELTGSAVVVSDPGALELRLNGAARRLLAQLEEGEKRLYGLIAPADQGRAGFSRHVDVEFVDGRRGRLHGYSTRLPRAASALVTVLELDREPAGRAAGALLPLTAREREVAVLVVDGHADREIAERLHLSRHTVSQYVKRIYRKLGVDSRVALTRLLLDRRWAP
jgi:DNA-binding CsgD family transcriptional regulator/GAF domain-containing protein